MLDRDAKGLIADGDPRVLREKSSEVRVREFLNRREEPVQRQSNPVIS
jgi:phospholipid/cholesterol/gamma-HCH transport system ATP-binding protein